MVRRSLTMALLGCLAVLGCGGDGSPTSPSGSGVPVFLVFVSAGSFNATLNGQTYSAQGGFNLSLAPGVYEISGTFAPGQTFSVALRAVSAPTQGGVQSGSVQSLTGPLLATFPCQVSYSSLGLAAPSSFRVRFTVVTNPNAACQ